MLDRPNEDPGQQQESALEGSQPPPTPLPEEGATPPAPGAGEAGSAPETPAQPEPAPEEALVSPAPNEEKVNKANSSPSHIVSLGVGLLLILGIYLGWKIISHEPPLAPPELKALRESFRNASWAEGPDPSKSGGFSLSDDRQVYTTVISKTDTILLGLPAPSMSSDEPSANEKCLAVKVAIESGQPQAYGIVFHYIDNQNFDLFTIEEGARRAYFQEIRDNKSKSSIEQSIGATLQDTLAGKPHRLLRLAISSQEVQTWLDLEPVMARKGEDLASGGIGLFVISGSQTETLPIRLSFSDLSVTRLSLDCWP